MTMGKLIMKEIRLVMHPTSLIFLCLSAMLLIPNYPYGVTFFYTGLAVFFTCLSGRENNDIYFTACLPVKKRDIVKARFAYVVLLQLAQVVIAVPFAIIRNGFDLPGNQVGMDANTAFFGVAFILLGLFNLSFFGIYYKDVKKVGKAFVASSIVVFVFMIVVEALTHILPLFRDYIDTKDPLYMEYKLAALAIGAVFYAAATFAAYIRSVKSFEKLDL